MAAYPVGPQQSSEGYYYLPHTRTINLPGLQSGEITDSPHLPLPQRANPPEVPGITDIQPERTGTDFGSDTAWKYTNNDHEVLKSAMLAVRLGPITATGGGINARYADDILCQAIDWLEFQIGGTVLQRLYGEEIHCRQLRNLIPEDLAAAYVLQRAGLTAADRAIMANPAVHAQGFWAYLDLPFWWTETANKHWHQYACQRTTRIVIHWRGPEYCLQQDNANSKPAAVLNNSYIQEMFLRFEVSALDTAVKAGYMNTVKDMQGEGLSYLLTYEQRQENQSIPIASTSTNIQLTNFNKPTMLVLIIVRKAANLIANYLNNRRFEFMPLSSYWADASGHRLQQRISDEYSKFRMAQRAFVGNPDVNLYYILHTDYADVVQYPMGNIEYGRLQNPTVTLTWDAPIGEAYTADIYAKCYNYVRFVISADNRSGVSLEQPI
jgi:hypothetical protein